MDPLVIALTFGAIFVVELPDKTFLAALVLSTKYRPVLVWVGVALAFLVQTVIAVALGKAAAFLPTDLVHTFAGLMFLAGSVILFREARSHATEEAADEAVATDEHHTGDQLPVVRQVVAAFLVLFAAEWGDLSQLLTLSLVAKYDDPWSVFVGAWGALLVVSGLAVIVGRVLLRFIPIHVLHYVGAGVCLVLAGLTAYEVLR
jgi:putative Ca2+/H+ antiporter (TMEM165/GDT1 family)